MANKTQLNETELKKVSGGSNFDPTWQDNAKFYTDYELDNLPIGSPVIIKYKGSSMSIDDGIFKGPSSPATNHYFIAYSSSKNKEFSTKNRWLFYPPNGKK